MSEREPKSDRECVSPVQVWEGAKTADHITPARLASPSTFFSSCSLRSTRTLPHLVYFYSRCFLLRNERYIRGGEEAESSVRVFSKAISSSRCVDIIWSCVSLLTSAPDAEFAFPPDPEQAKAQSPLKKERRAEPDLLSPGKAPAASASEYSVLSPSGSSSSSAPQGSAFPSSTSFTSLPPTSPSYAPALSPQIVSSTLAPGSTEGEGANEVAPIKFEPGLFPCRDVEIYKKVNRIEEGTYGVVYKAMNKETGA